jgi:hypothetical protein
MIRITVIVLFICGFMASGFAQDTAKKTAIPAKPYPTNKTPKYHSYTSRAKADSIRLARARQSAAAKANTPAPILLPGDNSLNAQYLRLVDRFYPHQEALISAFWKNALDTLNATRNRLKAAESKLSGQNKAADTVTKDTPGEEKPVPTSAAASVSGADGVNILGIQLSNTAYNLLVWGLVLIFGFTAVAVIARSGSFKREAKYRTQLYGELEEEFKTYKTKANDKEKKLARELQTERNKLDDLLGKG